VSRDDLLPDEVEARIDDQAAIRVGSITSGPSSTPSEQSRKPPSRSQVAIRVRRSACW
jgi:hypothetical protein